MTNIFNALEHCLQQIENGAEVESVLKQYPELANELRPILKTAIKAQRNQTAEPSAEAFKRGRAKVMQHATQLQQSPVIKRRNTLPVFSRLAISFALALIFLLGGTGVLSASASTIPGDRLYSVKRGWENVRLFLIFDQEARDLLQDEFENERLHEVNELISQGKIEQIQFAGIFMQVNGANYVSGVQITLPATIQAPVNGAIVSVIGVTNLQGWVDVSALELLPVGSTVPLGNPVEVIDQADGAESTTPSANEAIESTPQIVHFDIQGILQSISTTQLVINGQTVYLNNPQLVGQLCIGKAIQVKGYYETDGRFMVTEIFGVETCDGNGASNQNGNQNNNSGDDSNTNENNSNDDNSGGGGNSGNGDDDEDDGDDDDNDDGDDD